MLPKVYGGKGRLSLGRKKEGKKSFRRAIKAISTFLSKNKTGPANYKTS